MKGDLSQNLNSEVGLAIFDTGDLDCVPLTELMSTYNFASGSSEYQEKTRRRFLFGKSVAVTQDNMLQSIKSLIPRDRQVIFVGHDINHDLKALDSLKFDLSTYKISVLDTKTISAKIFSYDSFTLRCLLLTLGCPFMKLHCGGNDANFTLRALLLLASRFGVSQPGSERRLATLKDIALRPLQYHIRPQERTAETMNFPGEASQRRAEKKWAKRVERSRKHQSKLWDNETQEKIRAERAAKKVLAESFNVQWET